MSGGGNSEMKHAWKRYKRRVVVVLMVILTISVILGVNGRLYRHDHSDVTVVGRDLIIPPKLFSNDTRKHDVILSAYMNSGSRFTGRLLGYTRDSFYFYEPLWKFSIWDYFKSPNLRCSTLQGKCRKISTLEINRFQPDSNKKDTETIVYNISGSVAPTELFLHVLSNVYNCDFVHLKNVIQDRVQDHPSYGGPSWEVFRTCIIRFQPRSECLRLLESVCRNRTHRVIKVLRLTLGSYRPLLDINPRLKIVHLVRDPRAIVNSRIYSRGYPVYGYREDDSLEQNLCDKMGQDYYEGIELMNNYPGRVKFLYYEDLMANLHVRLKQLSRFLNMDYNKTEIEKLAKVQINLSPPEKGLAFKDDRTRDNSNWWRKYMQLVDIVRVNKACSSVMELYGYQSLNTERHIRDLRHQSLKIPDALLLDG